MPRIRCIKPEFCTSEQIAECSTNARLLFVTMWCFCDDAGRHVASVRRLKMECFPGDPFTVEEMDGMVSELIDAGLLVEYLFDGDLLWEVTGWKHQKIDRPNVKYGPKASSKEAISLAKSDQVEIVRSSKIRRAVDEQSTSDRRVVDESSPPDRKGREGIGEDRIGVSYVSLQTDECESEKDSPCEVVDAWNDRCDETDDPRMKPVRLTPKRRDKLKTRLSEAAFRDCWRLAIDNLPNPVRKNFDWTPDFDWLIKNDTNAVKIAEGVYASTTSDAAIAKARQSITEDF